MNISVSVAMKMFAAFTAPVVLKNMLMAYKNQRATATGNTFRVRTINPKTKGYNLSGNKKINIARLL